MRRWWRALCAALVLLAPATASAQSGNWLGIGNEWTIGSNWSTSPAVPSNVALFSNTGGTTSIDVSSSASINTLQFSNSAPAYSFNIANGATFTINSGIGVSTISPAFNVSSGATLNLGDGALTTIGALTGSGTVDIGSANTSTNLTINAGTTSTFSGLFAGVGTLELDNGTLLKLAGSSTYGTVGKLDLCTCNTGGLTVSGGLLTVSGMTLVESGTLSIVSGGSLKTSQTLTVSGALDIDGSGSSVTATGLTKIGGAGAGSLAISNGGTLTSQSDAAVGNLPLTAKASVDGAGSTWAVGGALTVGVSGNRGSLSVTNGGAVNVTGTATIGPDGTLNLGTGGLAGSLTASSIVNNGSIVANFTDALTLSTDIGGSGTLSKTGSGTLTLAGNDTMSTTVSAGRLVVNGSLTGDLTIASGATLGGAGSIAGAVMNNGTISLGSSIGTLTISDSYTQAAGSGYQVKVNGAGQSDLVNVTSASGPGSAQINGGTVQVAAASGSYGPRTTYTILSAAGGLTGTYAGVTGNFAFLQPSLSYDSDNVFLTLTRSFSSGAQTANQGAVAAVLDAATAGATGDFVTVLNAVGGLDPTQGSQALTAMSGQSYANVGSMSTQTGAAVMSAIQAQVGATHGPAAASSPRVALVDTRDAPMDACDFECDAARPTYGAWISGVGVAGSAAGNSNASGYGYKFGGTAVGADYRFSPRLLAGVGVGFTTGSLWTNGIGGLGTADTVSGSLYGSFTQDRLYVDGLVGYANTNDRTSRAIVISGLNPRVAQGQASINQFLGQIETGYRFDVPTSSPASITPFLRLQGSIADQGAFSESGADSLDLNVASQTTNSLRPTLGTDFAATIAKVTLDFRVGWMHEMADTSRPMTASFAGAPAYAFTVYGVAPQRDSAVIGLSANATVAQSTEFYLRYDGEVGGSSDNHALSAGVRMVW